jgi:hypothetical protein
VTQFIVPPAWIPAEGTPPDDDRYVLVARSFKPYAGYDDVETLADVAWYNEGDKTWNDEHGRELRFVTFWQDLPPLPEPPKATV